MDRYVAARTGHLEHIQKLVTPNDIDEIDQYGRTVLFHAIDGKKTYVTDWLIKCGATVNMRSRSGRTPLHQAAFESPSCLKLLLAAGADASAADDNGSIALHHACQSFECATLLIVAYPAGIHVTNNDGATPLFYAVAFGVPSVCLALLQEGSNVDTPDNNGETPLHVVLTQCTQEMNAEMRKYVYAVPWKRAVAELLLDYGARLDRVTLDNIPAWALSYVRTP